MNDLRTAAQQALEAMSSFESGTGGLYEGEFSAEIAALRAALAEPVTNQCGETCERAKLCAACARELAEPVQEPVAIVGTQEDTWKGYGSQWLSPGPPIKTVHMLAELPVGTPLYTTPPQRKPLTEEEIKALIDSVDGLGIGRHVMHKVARAIERAHGIGEKE